ncbi:MAG TPA: rRNA maturation RNase YbeY [Firmicutes bacterium]|nr:rRNA maturation RNase YbeY [Bacillota bacterium]
MTLLMDDRAGEALLPEEQEVFLPVCEQALQEEGFSLQTEVSLSLVTAEEIRQVNRRFRRIDRVTDVLSFPQLSFTPGEEEEKNERGEIILGDILICVARARSQAEEYGHSLRRELAFLTAHSMLHLLGYDHQTKAQEQEMFAKQEQILQSLGIPRR